MRCGKMLSLKSLTWCFLGLNAVFLPALLSVSFYLAEVQHPGGILLKIAVEAEATTNLTMCELLAQKTAMWVEVRQEDSPRCQSAYESPYILEYSSVYDCLGLFRSIGVVFFLLTVNTMLQLLQATSSDGKRFVFAVGFVPGLCSN